LLPKSRASHFVHPELLEAATQSEVSQVKVIAANPFLPVSPKLFRLFSSLTAAPSTQTAQIDEMASRPTVTILGADGAATGATHTIPSVFLSPIRPDIVQQVHTGMAKNKRQPYSVSEKAGHQTSAESWGTGQ